MEGGKEERIGGAQGVFRVVKSFCMILKWLIHDIICFSKTIECTIPRVNSNVNCGCK